MAQLLALDMVTLLSAVVIVLALSLLVVLRHFRNRVVELESALAEAHHGRRSLAATYGRITEQFAPFLAAYPFDPKNFRFLGSPIDGVQFEDDRVVFVEFKANASRLTEREARIRELVESGRVEWFEFRQQEDPGAAAVPPPGAREAAPPEAFAPAFTRREDAEDEDADRDAGAWSPSSWGAER